MNAQRDILQKPASVSITPEYALPVIDQKGAIVTTTTFTAGTDFVIPAGAAGASVTISLSTAPILGGFGRTGSFNNTTFAFGGAAAVTFTTEVPFIVDANGLGGDTSTLTNGQYMVDYEAGMLYAKKANNGTTGTCTYSYLTTLIS